MLMRVGSRLRRPFGSGATFMLVPGLVPDGPETFARQCRLFRRYGAVRTVTYPYDRFSLDELLEDLRRFVWSARAQGSLPILVGVSVGGGFCVELLRRERALGRELPLAGLVLISPLTCCEDLSPLLRRLLTPILASTPEASPPQAGERALERGRDLFRSLALRSAPSAVAAGGARRWLRRVALTLRAEPADDRLRARILATLERIPTSGAIARCAALAELRGLDPSCPLPLSSAPTLVLWGSKERHTLNVDGPGVAQLCRPDLAVRYLPRAEVHWLYDREGGAVPHASLLLHHYAFNRALAPFLRRQARGWRRGSLAGGARRQAALFGESVAAAS